MTIPPEILEQIEKKAQAVEDEQFKNCPNGWTVAPWCNSDTVSAAFEEGAEFAWELCQKQTPPAPNVSSDGLGNGPAESASANLVGAPHSDRDQKIAQAVEGLVLAAKGVNSWLASKKVYEEEPGSKKRILEIVDLTEALSKLEAANEPHK